MITIDFAPPPLGLLMEEFWLKKVVERDSQLGLAVHISFLPPPGWLKLSLT